MIPDTPQNVARTVWQELDARLFKKDENISPERTPPEEVAWMALYTPPKNSRDLDN